MIKIKKISLQNFKGIKPKTVFHFDNEESNVIVLSGPNGFGKTTAFDVIEFCLTGLFKRVEKFDNVQKKNNNRNKPFYQNTDGEDVILKLWLHNTTTDANHIIIKHYDDDESPSKIEFSRDFIPVDSVNIFTTYLSEDSRHFFDNNFTDLTPVEQSDISALFYGEGSNIDLTSTYYLFNYIQQEDSIYFLRQNEDEKGAHLGFLFNIEKEESEKQKLLELRNHISRQQATILAQISQLSSSVPENQSTEYQMLFPEKSYEFDKENPFTQLTNASDQLISFKNTLDSLSNLKLNFSAVEYEKYLKYKKLNDDVLTNDSVLKAILLKNIYTVDLISSIELINSKIVKANNFLQTSNTTFISKEYFDLFLPTPEEYAAYSVVENSIQSINRDLGSIGMAIADINTNRSKVLEEFKKVKHTDHISDSNCPLCDSGFTSFDHLEKAINEKSNKLETFSAEKLQQKVALEEKIKQFHLRISESVSAFVSQNKTTDQIILAKLREYPALKQKAEEITTTYPILTSPGMSTINFTHPPKTIGELEEKQGLLKAFLERELLPSLQYNPSLMENHQLYLEYFDSDKVKFSAITDEMISNKSKYLSSIYAQLANSRLIFLNSRNQKLTKLLSSINSIYDKVHSTIQAHKAEMIKKIKVPFYIYSGKILQSYQQGLGIFIEIHPTNQSNNVRFKTGHSSDHDIVYHLSSGQMAVVSLAFCLSLNKVYNTNEHFKFLSIDDPVQTMDDLNIHTFIELVRNEFKEFQIIMSTHDDFTSRYMKYKFDKFNMLTEIQNIQKIVLEQSSN